MPTTAHKPPLQERIDRHRKEIKRLVEEHGASTPRLFGSLARGEETAGSDLDLLVKAGDHTSAWFPAGLIQDLEELLGCPVDVVTEDGLHWALRERVFAEAQQL